MFHISKITPFLFLVAVINLFISLIFKILGDFEKFVYFAVFGFIGTTLIAAKYQIIPNSQNRKLKFEFISYIVALALTSSHLVFLIDEKLIASAVLLISCTLFLIHSLLNIRNWMPVTVKFIGASVFYLFLSSLFLFLYYKTAAVPFALAVHTLTAGSMLNAIYGVELAWIPMLIMETLNIRKAQRLFIVKQVSTPLLISAFFLKNYYLIALISLVEIGVALYFLYLIYELFKRRRMASQIPFVVKMFLTALILLPIGLVMGSQTAVNRSLFYIHMDLMVYGFGALTIFGGMLHLFPRIMWNWKFKGKNITVNELVDEKGAELLLPVFTIFFVLFLATDNSFFPLNILSAVFYVLILLFFLKITLIHFIKKLKEVRDGGN